jgi:hypothetical protein
MGLGQRLQATDAVKHERLLGVIARRRDRGLRIVQQLILSFQIGQRVEMTLQIRGGEAAATQQALAHSAVELEILGFAHANVSRLSPLTYPLG